MGFPQTIKTDNDPAYTGKIFQTFCKEWQIKYVTYNHLGQASLNVLSGPSKLKFFLKKDYATT